MGHTSRREKEVSDRGVFKFLQTLVRYPKLMGREKVPNEVFDVLEFGVRCHT